MPEMIATDKRVANLAANLRRIRNERDLSLSELSRISGVPKRTIANVEHGTDPSLSTAFAIAAGLDVTLDDLTEEPPKT